MTLCSHLLTFLPSRYFRIAGTDSHLIFLEPALLTAALSATKHYGSSQHAILQLHPKLVCATVKLFGQGIDTAMKYSHSG